MGSGCFLVCVARGRLSSASSFPLCASALFCSSELVLPGSTNSVLGIAYAWKPTDHLLRSQAVLDSLQVQLLLLSISMAHASACPSSAVSLSSEGHVLFGASAAGSCLAGSLQQVVTG